MRKSFQVEKQRHEVAVQRFAVPLRDAAPRALESFWSMRHTFDHAMNAAWHSCGPDNFSGRATCLVIDPNVPALMYAGSAAGGLWKSEDGGNNWRSCWPHSLSQNIGAVAIDPDDCARIICATGEGNLSTASYPGSGIYLSEDAGFSWVSYLFVPGQRRMTPADRDAMPRRVCGISFGAKNPTTGRRLTAFASISNDEQLPGGLYMPDPKSGRLEFVRWWSSRPYNCYSVVCHPTEPDTVFAAIEAGGTINGIWQSIDAGVTWKQLTNGLPSGELCGRITLAISTKDPTVRYALVSTRQHKVLGVFRYNQGTDEWKNTAGGEFADDGQLAFNSSIAIHPADPRTVVVGARYLYRSTDSGDNWRPIGDQHRALNSRLKNPRYVHADHHALVMPGGKLLYSANDGGIARSTDLGDTWDSKCRGMNTVMFYAIDVSPKNEQLFGGGSQDNGTLLAGVRAGFGMKRKGAEAASFTQVLEGDGGYVVCDPHHQELIFASDFSTGARCHEPGSRWARGLLRTKWRDASPNVSKEEKELLGLAVMAIKPADGKHRRELFLGTNRLWRSRNNGRSWVASPFQLDGSAVTAIEAATADRSTMFAGTARGGIFRSDDGGQNWSADLAGPEIPNRVITQVETHPRDARIVVVTVASTGRPAASLAGDAKPYSHVFRSTDGGRNWQDIDQGGLPNVVFNGLAFETHAPYRIFVAGDAGPWVLQENGRWASIAGDMPGAVISDIVYHHKSRTLTAGTYGRGIYRLHVPARFQIAAAETGVDANAMLPPIEGYFLDRQAPVPQPISPAPGTEFNNFPRYTDFVCTKVRGAIGYAFETADRQTFFQVKASETPAAQMEMDGSGEYTWTCWALFPGGRCSFPTVGTQFRYLR